MANGVGNPSKTPLEDIQWQIAAAESRSNTTLELIDAAILEGRDPRGDEALQVACQTVEGHMKEALRLIHLYRP
jgi:hypothetical protein